MAHSNSLKVLVKVLQVALFAGFACTDVPESTSPQSTNNMAESMRGVLKKHSVTTWYPLVLDTVYGGYLSDFSYKWEIEGAQNKMIVSQARHVWTCSKLAEFYEEEQPYDAIAAHGFDFLRDKMWDAEFGGFYDLVDQQGVTITDDSGRIIKTAYGNAFAIYGLSAFYKAFDDPQALELAKEAFHWLEKHSYDSLNGGYFQFLAQNGVPFKEGMNGTPPKDQNSSIHLLEAFTELYDVWPQEHLKNRLNELFFLIRDTVTTRKGHMNLFFHQDWTPYTYKDSLKKAQAENFNLDHVSFGHDIETAYLLLEASHTLGNDSDPTTLAKAKVMVDHTLNNGWDGNVGGIYDGGYYFDSLNSISIIKEGKVWWAQSEALNTLLIMSHLYPDDAQNYGDKFSMQWDYIQSNLIDEEYGGWYWGGLDQEPEYKTFPKGQIWKVNYHTVRSLINCINGLERQ